MARLGKLAAAGVAALIAGSADAPRAAGVLDIEFDIVSPLAAAVVTAMDAAEAFWETQLTGYATQLAFDQIGAFELRVGDSSILPTGVTFPAAALAGAITTSFITDGQFVIAASGDIAWNEAFDFNSRPQSFVDGIAIHEVGHALGFGDFSFGLNGLIDGDDPTRYIGSEAVAAYQIESGDPTATFVPLEDDGGPGTAFGHWDEFEFLNHGADLGLDPALCDVVVNNPLPPGCEGANNPELMTGVAPDGDFTFSQTTLAAFRDVGYLTADENAAEVPLPLGGALLLSALGMFAYWRRKPA
ncbi:MAG: leishmanolysin-related zinc metalloendopeptidase [Pseudomonadota bacterium]